jgi:apolipoprotein N-acyltransferase
MKDRLLKDIIVLFIAAVFLMLSTPPFNFFFCAYLFLPIALKTIKTCEKPGVYGFIFGMIYNCMSMYWIIYVLTKYGNIPYFASFFLFLLLASYLSLYQSLFFYIFKKFINSIPVVLSPLIFSFFWVALEFIRSKILTGFPWMLVGYTQYNFLPIIQLSSLMGVYLVSFVVIFISLSIYFVVIREKFWYINAIFSFILMIAIIIWGNEQISKTKKEFEKKKRLQVLLIQGNIDQSQKWEKDLQRKIILKHIKMTKENIDEQTNLVVWSETAMPLIYGADREITEFLKEHLSSIKAPLISGFVGYKWDELGNPKLTNSAGIFYEGELIDKYDKVHLVPFGEYVPLQKILFFVNKLVSAAGDFVAGDKIKTCNFKNLSYGITICYESIFPEISKTMSSNGADVLVNITNDAWFGNSPAPYQHFVMSIFRAVENKKYLIRVANTGITGIITPWGEVLSKTKLYEDSIIKGTVYYR